MYIRISILTTVRETSFHISAQSTPTPLCDQTAHIRSICFTKPGERMRDELDDRDDYDHRDRKF